MEPGFFDGMGWIAWIAFVVVCVAVLVCLAIAVSSLRDLIKGDYYDGGLAGPLIFAIVIFLLGIAFIQGSKWSPEQRQYEDRFHEATMACIDWEELFRENAMKDGLVFWRGGDTQNGELLLYYQQKQREENPCWDEFQIRQRSLKEVIGYITVAHWSHTELREKAKPFDPAIHGCWREGAAC